MITKCYFLLYCGRCKKKEKKRKKMSHTDVKNNGAQLALQIHEKHCVQEKQDSSIYFCDYF